MGETHCPCVSSGWASEQPTLCPVPSPALAPLGLQGKTWALWPTLASLVHLAQIHTVATWGWITPWRREHSWSLPTRCQ